MQLEPVSQRVMNLAHFVEQAAMRHPQAMALAWGDQQWNWREMNARINAMAYALVHDFAVLKGDRIIVQSTNCNQMFESMLACFRIGAIWVPANFRGSPDDLDWMATSSGAVGLICHADFPEHAKKLQTKVNFTLAIGAADFAADYDALVSKHSGAITPLVAVDYHDPCWFFFTSGSTGKPKAVVLTHGHMAFVVTNHLADLMPATTEQDVSLVVAPLSHGAGVHALVQVARGVASILPKTSRFDPHEIWRLVEKYQVSNMFTVPTILKILIEHPAVDQVDHSSLRYVIYAGAPMYQVDQENALAKIGLVLVQYFGLGEVTGNITVLPAHLHHKSGSSQSGSCGYARTGMQVQIQDKQGAELPVGETGEICVIGPAVFKGYWNNPAANAQAFRNGWFRTGDVGHMDQQGFFYITGRESDMYISGGSNIYPREIEEKILQHADINEVAVIGIADAKWGEVGVAICVAREGVTVANLDIEEFLSGKIASYKMPKQFTFWPELPKSAYGKITKKLVKEQYFANSADQEHSE